MSKTKEQKQEIINQLQTELKKAKSLIFVDYYGLPVSSIDELRKLLKQKSGRYLVAKKTLLKLALDNIGLKDIDLNKLTGGLGLVLSLEEETTLAKLVVDFTKTHKPLTIQGGIFKSEFVEVETIETLAKLPSREELLAQLVGTIKAPLSNLVYVLSGNFRNLVYVLSAIKK